MENLVSVIVPVYNSRAWLSECLESIGNQTYRNLEILLVDNGSTDGSAEICAEYAGKDGRVRVIPCEHKGPGAARNIGIREAKGKAVIFVDSDDVCTPRQVEKLLEAWQEEEDTLVVCGILITDEKGEGTGRLEPVRMKGSAREYAACVLAQKKTSPLCGGVYNKLYDLRVLRDNQVLFEENATYAEDFCFNLAYLRHVKNVVMIPDALYRYRCGRKGSLTEKNLRESDFTAFWQRRLEVIRAFEELYAFFDLTEECAADLSAFYWMQMNDMIMLAARRAPDYESFRKNMEILKKDIRGHETLSVMPRKDRLSLHLLQIHQLRILWGYEKSRRKLRQKRGRERWDG